MCFTAQSARRGLISPKALILPGALLVLMLYPQSSTHSQESLAGDEELLPYPKQLVVPEKISTWRQTSITEDDGSLSEVIFSPLNSYVYGHYIGWRQCVINAAKEGYMVVAFDSKEVSARCALKCMTAEFRQGTIQGYKDCQDALKRIKGSGVSEDQLRVELKKSNCIRVPFRSDVF